MAGLVPRRSATRFFAGAIVVSIAALVPSTVSAASSSALESQIDVAEFSGRAASYAFAYSNHRAEALDQAAELAREGQQAEAEREDEERLTALARTQAAERARVATTVAPTVTVAPTTVAPTTTLMPVSTVTTTPPVTTNAPSGGPTAEQWAALRHCESGGRYDAVNPSGHYRGAYQFSQATWDWVAGVSNQSLVGVDPAAAAPADQDAQAFALYDMRGPSPWPTCGAHLQ